MSEIALFQPSKISLSELSVPAIKTMCSSANNDKSSSVNNFNICQSALFSTLQWKNICQSLAARIVRWRRRDESHVVGRAYRETADAHEPPCQVDEKIFLFANLTDKSRQTTMKASHGTNVRRFAARSVYFTNGQAVLALVLLKVRQ